MDTSVDFIAGAVFSIITSGSGDHNACVHQPAYCEAKWIVSVRLHRWSAKAHVDDPDVVSGAVGQHPVEGLKQAANRSGSLRVKHTKVEDISVRCDAGVLRVRDAAVARSHRSHMSSVTVGIVGAPFTGKITVDDDALVIAPVQKCLVTYVNSRIQNGDSDSGAVQPGSRRAARLTHSISSGSQ